MTAATGITVLIPAYRAQATIDRALASVLAQRLQPDEVIIVDDGSPEPLQVKPDTTAPISLKLLRLSQNAGSSAALNFGLEHVQTEWTAFLDADDSWHADKLTKQIELATRQPDTALIATGLRFLDANGHKQMDVATQPLPEDATQRLASLIEDCVIGKPSVMARTKILRAMGGFNTGLVVGEDQDLWLRIAAAHRVDVVPEILTYVHDTPGSLSKRADVMPDYLWSQVIRPAIAQHRSKFSAAQLRRIIGVRRQQAAVAQLVHGSYGKALAHLWQATRCGYQPLQNVSYALTPLKKCLKKNI